MSNAHDAVRRTTIRMALLLALLPLVLSAQRTNDEARLVVGLNGGYIGGSGLWAVTQEVQSLNDAVDHFHLSRSLRSNLTLAGHLTYFPASQWGVTGEISYIGLGTLDSCHLVEPTGYDINRLACDALNENARAASAVAAMGGGVWRPIPRGDVQLYLKGQVGLALVPRSTTTVTAFFTSVKDGEITDFAVPIYAEDGSKSVAPIGSLALGFATAPNNGYQFSAEFRATAVRLQVVDGPAAVNQFVPPIRGKWSILPTITVGFDIVLEKHRGRRY